MPSVVTADTGVDYLQINGNGGVGMVQLGSNGADGSVGLWDSTNGVFKYITQGDGEIFFGDQIDAPAFSGVGVSLTSLNASNISSGTLALARGGTGASLADPNADRLLFWDDSAGQVTWLEAGSGLTISGTTISASGGGSATPGGTDTQVQFNDGGAFGGDSGLTYAKTTDTLTGVNQTFTGTSTLTHIHGNIAGSLYVHVKNDSGVTLAKGTPVYATGSVGSSGEILVAAADSTNTAKMPCIGIIDSQLIANAEGNAVVVGEVFGLTTDSYVIGDELFVSTGTLTKTRPTTGEAQSVAVVSRAHASTGIIVVNTQQRLNAALTILANSSIADPNADRLLFWDDSAGQVTWLTAGSGLSISGTTITANIGGTVGTTDNAIPRADGEGGSTLQGSLVTIADNGTLTKEEAYELGVNGSNYGRIGLWDADNTDWLYLQAGPSKIIFPDIAATSFAGAGNQITNLNAGNITSGTLGVTNGGTGATTLTANAVLLGNGTSAVQVVAPGTSGNVLTSDGTTWTSSAPATTNPAGSGSELQFRSSGTAFGAVTNSSVSSGAITLGAAEALGATSTARLTLANTTAAAAGAQQVSPSLVFEGQGWKTTATAASQTVRFRENVLPVQGTTNPSAQWQLQSEINNSGTWDNQLNITSAGNMYRGFTSTFINLGGSDIVLENQSTGRLIEARIPGNGLFNIVGTNTLGPRLGFSATNGNTAPDLQLTRAAAASLQLGANTATASATAVAQTIKGPNATGTTSTGGSLTLAGGTGTTAGGAVILATSTSTGAPVDRINISSAGVVKISDLSTNGIVTANSGNGTLQTVAPSTTGNVLTSDGTTWTSAAAVVRNPAGSGSELQFRSSGTAFGAVTGSTVSGGAVTLADKLTITQGTANANVLQSTGYSLTGTNASSLIDLAGTWNTTGTPSAIKLDITDTASNSNSLLMQLLVGGANRFRIFKNGDLFALGNLNGTIVNFSNYCAGGDSGQFILGASLDTRLQRDAAAVWAMRNGTNRHELRVYDTFSTASDFHRIAIATARATLTNVTGATVTATALIPAGSVIMGVTSKVTTALGTGGGTTGYQIGTATDADRWADKTGTVLGTQTDNRDWTSGTIENFATATDVIVTAKGGNFNGTGVIYISVQYMAGQVD